MFSLFKGLSTAYKALSILFLIASLVSVYYGYFAVHDSKIINEHEDKTKIVVTKKVKKHEKQLNEINTRDDIDADASAFADSLLAKGDSSLKLQRTSQDTQNTDINGAGGTETVLQKRQDARQALSTTRKDCPAVMPLFCDYRMCECNYSIGEWK